MSFVVKRCLNHIPQIQPQKITQLSNQSETTPRRDRGMRYRYLRRRCVSCGVVIEVNMLGSPHSPEVCKLNESAQDLARKRRRHSGDKVFPRPSALNGPISDNVETGCWLSAEDHGEFVQQMYPDFNDGISVARRFGSQGALIE